MPRINMIASKRAEKLRLAMILRKIGLAIVAEILIAFAVGAWMATSYFTKMNTIADLNVKISELQPTVREIETFQAAINKLKPKLTLLNKAKESTMQWYGLMDRLTESIPNSAHLTRFTTTSAASTDKTKTPEIKVAISGAADSQTRVGEIMLRLQSISELSDIELHYTQRSTGLVNTTVDFEVGGTFMAAEITSDADAPTDGSVAQSPAGVK